MGLKENIQTDNERKKKPDIYAFKVSSGKLGNISNNIHIKKMYHTGIMKVKWNRIDNA